MQFEWNPTQNMLKQTARKLLTDRCSSPHLRQLADSPDGWDADLWQALADVGFLGLLIPEQWGGTEGGAVELAAIQEEVGRHLLPAPFLETVLVGEAIRRAGSPEQQEQWLPRLASGEVVATVAWLEEDGELDHDSLNTEVLRGASGYRLTGRKVLVPFGHVADVLLCPVCEDGGVSLYLVERKHRGVTVTQEPGLDLTYRLTTVDLAGAEAELLGPPTASCQLLKDLLWLGSAVLAAEMVGGAERALEMAVDYAKERQQFDRPIGSFQAIKHRCADMLMLVENSRSAAQYAAWALAEGQPDAAEACALAKAYASEAGPQAVAGAIQVHGGIGFTWEHDLHLYLRRQRRCSVQFGAADWHYAALADHIAAAGD